MFGWLRALSERAERRRMREVFGRYVDPATVDLLLDSDSKPLPPLDTPRRIAFVIVEVRPAPIGEHAPAISAVIELAMERLGIIDAIVSHLVIVTFGSFPTSPVGMHRTFVEAALAKFGTGVRIAHSEGDGYLGDLGSAKRKAFTFMHPAFPKALAALPGLAFGESLEI